jgi:hypothetical protein
VFVADAVTGVVERVSGLDPAGGPWWEASIGPALDAAGRYVAFSSRHPIDADDVGSDYDLMVQAVAAGGGERRAPD